MLFQNHVVQYFRLLNMQVNEILYFPIQVVTILYQGLHLYVHGKFALEHVENVHPIN